MYVPATLASSLGATATVARAQGRLLAEHPPRKSRRQSFSGLATTPGWPGSTSIRAFGGMGLTAGLRYLSDVMDHDAVVFSDELVGFRTLTCSRPGEKMCRP
jgi:hypothetical protein